MSSWVKNVFVIIGTMMLSLILFQLIMGDIGRSLIWKGLEPVFQKNWEVTTLKDGNLVDQQYADNFNSLHEVQH